MFSLNIPNLIFGTVIAGLIGSLIHFIFGGKPLRLLFSILFSWIGFWVGDNLGQRYGVSFFLYGSIYLGTAIAPPLFSDQIIMIDDTSMRLQFTILLYREDMIFLSQIHKQCEITIFSFIFR